MFSWCLSTYLCQAQVSKEALAGFVVYFCGHVRDEVEMDHNPSFPIACSCPCMRPLIWVPACVHYAQTSPSSPYSLSSPSQLGQLWNLIVPYKRNFVKSTVSVRLFNSDYNRAKGCTCTGFSLHIERLCIRVRCLLHELLLCNFFPHESLDL